MMRRSSRPHDGLRSSGVGGVLALVSVLTFVFVQQPRLGFIVAAVVTPPDVISQLSLAVPMCLLYEGGIIAARLFVKHTKAPEGATEA